MTTIETRVTRSSELSRRQLFTDNPLAEGLRALRKALTEAPKTQLPTPDLLPKQVTRRKFLMMDELEGTTNEARVATSEEERPQSSDDLDPWGSILKRLSLVKMTRPAFLRLAASVGALFLAMDVKGAQADDGGEHILTTTDFTVETVGSSESFATVFRKGGFRTKEEFQQATNSPDYRIVSVKRDSKASPYTVGAQGWLKIHDQIFVLLTASLGGVEGERWFVPLEDLKYRDSPSLLNYDRQLKTAADLKKALAREGGINVALQNIFTAYNFIPIGFRDIPPEWQGVSSERGGLIAANVGVLEKKTVLLVMEGKQGPYNLRLKVSDPKAKGGPFPSILELAELRQLTAYFPHDSSFTIAVDSDPNILRKLIFLSAGSNEDLNKAFGIYNQRVAEKPQSFKELLIPVGGVTVAVFILAFIRHLLRANVKMQDAEARFEAEERKRQHELAQERIRKALAAEQEGAKPSPEPLSPKQARKPEAPPPRAKARPRPEPAPGATPFLDLREFLRALYLISMMQRARTDQGKPQEPPPQEPPSEPIIEGQYRVVTDTDKPAEPPKALPPPSSPSDTADSSQ